ncbi:hypothetical protein, partial [Enterococcus faecalis]|uniref:hypothetical protein n=1 Tax=Enterococcus faecalis TaxID=1351 RepID=UPI003D6B2FCF
GGTDGVTANAAEFQSLLTHLKYITRSNWRFLFHPVKAVKPVSGFAVSERHFSNVRVNMLA